MTQLLLIGAVSLGGVAFAVVVARWLLRVPVGEREVVRMAGLVGGGVSRYLRRQTAVAAAVAAVVGAFVLLAYGVAYQTGWVTSVPARAHGLWNVAGYLLGAVFAAICATVAAWVGRQASVRVAAGIWRSLDESLQIAMRGGAVSGVVSLALAALGVSLLYFAAFLYYGPASLAGGVSTPQIPLLLPGFALGAAFVALLSQLGGGIFGVVADLGADAVGSTDAQLPERGTANPAAVADLVGDQVGDAAPRSAGVFAAAAAESLAAMLLAMVLYRRNPELQSAAALLLFPLVNRGFGFIAAWFGVMVVRTDDTELPMSALSRGLIVTTVLYMVGAAGAAKWLLGAHWWAFGSCAVVGAACSLCQLAVTQYYADQRHRPVRMVAEAARSGPTIAVLRGMVAALEGTMAHLLLVFVAASAAYLLGASSGLEGGGLFGVAVAVGGMLGSAPYVLAMDAMGSIADTAGGLIELTKASERADVRARARLLDSVGSAARSFTQAWMATASSLTCFLLVVAFLVEIWERTGTDSVDVTNPGLYFGGLAGTMVVLAFVWVTLRRVTSSGREFLNEIRVQFGRAAAGQRGNTSQSVGDLLPLVRAGAAGGETLGVEDEQLACTEIVSRIALRGMLTPAILGIGLPFLIGVGLRLLSAPNRVPSSAEALVALLIVATMATALTSLLSTSAGSVWDNAKKYIETGAHGGRYRSDHAGMADTAGGAGGAAAVMSEAANPTYLAAVVGDTVGDPLKGAVAPSLQALLKTLTAMALVFLPFFL